MAQELIGDQEKIPTPLSEFLYTAVEEIQYYQQVRLHNYNNSHNHNDRSILISEGSGATLQHESSNWYTWKLWKPSSVSALRLFGRMATNVEAPRDFR